MRKVAIIVAALSLTACDETVLPGSSVDGTYVGGTETQAFILRLTSNPDGTLAGNVGVTEMNYGEGKLDLTSKAISGREADGQLFLTAHSNEFGVADTPVTGELDGSDIILRAPGGTVALTLERGNQEDYDERVEVLAANLTANDVGMLPDD